MRAQDRKACSLIDSAQRRTFHYCATFVYFSFFSFVTISLGLSACNSSGHLSNHAEVAPSHAGLTFAISNTLVSTLPFIMKSLNVLNQQNYNSGHPGHQFNQSD